MRPLGTGLIGLNYGRKLLERGLEGGSLEVVACYDPDSKLRSSFAAEFGCDECDTARKLCSHPEIEAVLIASPNHAHLEHAWLAASADRHVFVEKPMTNTLAEAREMIDICRRAGVKLCVGHNSRFYGAHFKIRELIGEGRIGKPLAVECHCGAGNAFGLEPGDWRRSEALCPGLPLIQMAIHQIDTMRTVLGDVVSVSAHFQNLMVDMPNPDLTALLLEFENGVTASLISTYIHNDYYTVWHGSEGVLRYMHWPDRGRIERLDSRGHVDESDHWIDFEPVDSRAYELRDFQQAVREDREPQVDGEEGLRSLLPVLAAVESARNGRRVYLDELV